MTRQTKFKAFLKEWGAYTAVMLLFLLSYIFLWQTVAVQGHSMDPTFKDGERLILVKHTSLERFDIVVTEEREAEGKTHRIVKRIIGLPGDTISYKDDVLTVNGKTVKEPYLKDYLAAFQKDRLQSTYSYNPDFQQLAKFSPAFTSKDYEGSFTLKVPKNEYFLLGDNRVVSKDSRSVGTFSKDSILGEIKFRFWPLNHMNFF